ncbi:MAG: type II secretion system minor pseudopilin GspH [Rhodanobacteraceae bacterium]
MRASSRIPKIRVATRSRRHPRGGGFTLIEILVVLVIMAVLALAVTLAVGGSGERQLQHQAERFETLVALALERAQLSGREIGVVVTAKGYEFRMLDGDTWQPAPATGEMRPRDWVQGLRLELAREGRLVDLGSGDDSPSPQLVCFSSGELTAFTLTLALGDAPARYRVQGQGDGTLKLDRVALGR